MTHRGNISREEFIDALNNEQNPSEIQKETTSEKQTESASEKQIAESEIPSDRTDALETAANDHHEKPVWFNTAMAFKKAVEEEDLDIYQVCAWVSRQGPDTINIPAKISYYAKAFICWAIQIPGLMIFLYGQDRKESIPSALGKGCSAFDSGLVLQSSPLEHTRDALNLGMLSFLSLRYVQLDPLWENQENLLCEMKGSDSGAYMMEVQVLATMFAFYISAKTGGTIFDIGRHGLYTMNFYNGEDCPPCVTRWWVFVGAYTNVFTSLTSILGSYLVLYHSDTMLDVILNSVALFFVNDVDDFMLNKRDYRRIEQWFENWKAKGNMGHRHMNMMGGFLFGKILSPIALAATFFTVFVSFVAPFWIAICH